MLMAKMLAVVLLVMYISFMVTGQDVDQEDELFDPWKDNCETMNPGNFTNSALTPREPPMPYKVSFSRTKMNFEQGLYITLSAVGEHTFQGFMIHGLDVASGEGTGQFDNQQEDIDVFTCFGHLDSSAMHVNNTSKKSLTLRWVPDDVDVMAVSFYVTVAESVDPLENYWIRQHTGKVDIVKTLTKF